MHGFCDLPSFWFGVSECALFGVITCRSPHLHHLFLYVCMLFLLQWFKSLQFLVLNFARREGLATYWAGNKCLCSMNHVCVSVSAQCIMYIHVCVYWKVVVLSVNCCRLHVVCILFKHFSLFFFRWRNCSLRLVSWGPSILSRTVEPPSLRDTVSLSTSSKR